MRARARWLALAFLLLAVAACGNSPSPGGVCGDPAFLLRLPACQQAAGQRDEAACVAAGGTWDRFGLNPAPICLCPTGQESCTCTRPGDCVGSCTKPLASGGLATCSAEQAHCSATTVVIGCLCLVDDSGQARPICID